MKLSFVVSVLICAFLLFIFPSHQGKISKYHADIVEANLSSANPPAARTGAPGEANCTGCHLGTTQSATGIIDITFSGAGNEYLVGEIYTITIGIASGAKNGFEMTILDGSDTKAGTFLAGTNSSVTTSSGRQYIRHTASTGILSWSFTWTAPAADAGDLTMYYAFNNSNASGNTAGDIIYLGQFNLTSAIFNTITPHEKADESYNVFYNAESNEINLSYMLDKASKVMLNIQDISGKLIQQTDLGTKSQGNHAQLISLKEQPSPGIYIVSLFVDNNVFNRKISIN